MVTRQAKKVMDNLLERNPEGVTWDRAVEEMVISCDVKRNTAEAYVRGVEGVSVDITHNGERMIVRDQGDSDTVVYNENEVVDKPVGRPTGQYFSNIEVLEDNGHPLLDNLEKHKSGYIRRRMGDRGTDLGRKTDVQVITSTMSLDDYGTMLIGKHGVGKDKCVLHICANRNQPAIRVPANDDPDFVDLLVGTYRPDEDGNFQHKKGLLTIAIENGYCFVLDEFNLLSGKVQSMLNMMLEDADQSKLVIPETNEVIEPHDEFQFVATMNPNEIGYSDREDVDQATGSRMVPVELPPLSEEGEKKVVAGETHWSETSEDLNTLLRQDGGLITGIRASHDMGKISAWPSTRDVIQIGQMSEKLGSTQAAAELVLVGRADPADKQTIREEIHGHKW